MLKRYERDYSISFIRLIATIFIVACHFFQFYKSELAWWFNVGVQIFFVISGFLHGKTKETDLFVFFKKKFKNIILEYYVFGIIVLIFLILTNSITIAIKEFVKIILITGATEFSSLKQFWFLPYILLCYILTPLLYDIINNLKKDKMQTVGQFIWFWIKIVFLMLILEVVFLVHFPTFKGAWINCYILGMAFSAYNNTKTKKHMNYWLALIIIVLTIFINGIKIIVNYIIKPNLNDIAQIIFLEIADYAHVLLAISIFILIRSIKDNIYDNKILQKLLSLSDRYSYSIFLTHPFWVWSNYSPLKNIDNKFVACSLSLIFIIISSCVLKKISTEIDRKLLKRKMDDKNKIKL